MPVEQTTTVGQISIECEPGKVMITFDDVTYIFPEAIARELSVAVMKKAFEAKGKESAD